MSIALKYSSILEAKIKFKFRTKSVEHKSHSSLNKNMMIFQQNRFSVIDILTRQSINTLL